MGDLKKKVIFRLTKIYVIDGNYYLSLAKLFNVVLGYVSAIIEPDPSAKFFAHSLIGNADDLSFQHVLMTVKNFLDLTRVQIFTAPNDHVFNPAHDLRVTVGIDHRLISSKNIFYKEPIKS